MKRAILVVGPESSGTRWLTSLFIAAGCIGSAEHEQPFDRELPVDESPIVIRRSVPYWGRRPVLGLLAKRLTKFGYAVHAVVIVRDWYATAQSQVANGHVKDVATAEAQMRESLVHILMHLGEQIPFTWVTYEGLVQRPEETLAWLMPRFGLSVPAVNAVDGNAKYYGGDE